MERKDIQRPSFEKRRSDIKATCKTFPVYAMEMYKGNRPAYL